MNNILKITNNQNIIMILRGNYYDKGRNKKDR